MNPESLRAYVEREVPAEAGLDHVEVAPRHGRTVWATVYRTRPAVVIGAAGEGLDRLRSGLEDLAADRQVRLDVVQPVVRATDLLVCSFCGKNQTQVKK